MRAARLAVGGLILVLVATVAVLATLLVTREDPPPPSRQLTVKRTYTCGSSQDYEVCTREASEMAVQSCVEPNVAAVELTFIRVTLVFGGRPLETKETQRVETFPCP